MRNSNRNLIGDSISMSVVLCFLFILPFGELVRLQLTNGINITALDAVALISIVALFYQFLRDKTYLQVPFTIPILLFVGSAALSLLMNSLRFPLVQLFIGSLYLFRWIALMSIYILFSHVGKKNKEKLRVPIILSGSLLVIFGYLQYFLYPNLKNLFYAGWDEHYLRLFSTFFDPNFVGIYLVLFFLYLLDVWFKNLGRKNFMILIFYSILLLATCIAVLLTYSRSAFFGLTCGLVLYLFPKGYKMFLTIFGIVVFLFVLFVIFLTGVPSEGAHLLRVPSSLARIDSASHAFTIFLDNPLFGVGFDTYRYAQKQHGFLGLATWEASHAASGADNSFLFILATTGIVGFLAYCFMLFKIMRYFFVSASSYTSLIVASYAALMASSFFINGLFYAPLMALLWILLGFTVST